MFKIFKDILLLVFLFIAMSKMGNAHEEFDDGGIRTKDGCYTMIIVVNTNEGKKSNTVKDCRGGRAI